MTSGGIPVFSIDTVADLKATVIISRLHGLCILSLCPINLEGYVMDCTLLIQWDTNGTNCTIDVTHDMYR